MEAKLLSIQRITFITLAIFFLAHGSIAQKNDFSAVGIEASFGASRGSGAFSFNHFWLHGKKKQFELGLGARLTSIFGDNQYFQSAPANLASNSTSTDSLFVGSAQVNSLNLMVNFGYRLSDKFLIGFNIDLIGFSFGGSTGAIYVNGSQQINTMASPSSFNLLLVDNNDKGTLNSRFFVRYTLNQKWSISAGAQHLFSEYTTETKVQTVPEPNDRFRIKSTLISIGTSYRLN